jgi:hypothetical protein
VVSRNEPSELSISYLSDMYVTKNRFSVALKCECVTVCITFWLTGIVVNVRIPTDFGKYVRRVWKLAHFCCNCMQQPVVRLTAEQDFSCKFDVLAVMLQKNSGLLECDLLIST